MAVEYIFLLGLTTAEFLACVLNVIAQQVLHDILALDEKSLQRCFP